VLIKTLWLWASFFIVVVGLAATSGLIVALGAFVLLVGGVARLWSRLALERVTYQRTMPERRAFVGEQLRLRQTVANGKPLPLPWIEVEERLPLGLAPVDRQLLPSYIPGTGLLPRGTGLSWYQKVSWECDLDCRERGYYRLGPTVLRSGDLFGFFTNEIEDPAGDEVLVLPRMYDLESLGYKPRHPSGELRGLRPLIEDPLRPAGVRDYRPGDPSRRIEWKATARRRTLQSKVFEPSASLELMVALNINTLEKSWEGYDPVLLERAISVAASVARDSLALQQPTGIVANGSYPGADRPLRVPPASSRDQLLRVLEALAVISPLTITSLARMLEEQRRMLGAGSSLVVVTAIVDRALEEGLLVLAERYPVTLLAVGAGVPAIPGVETVQVGKGLDRQEEQLRDAPKALTT
jgi:uncharacterized protein (DUF58 family)